MVSNTKCLELTKYLQSGKDANSEAILESTQLFCNKILNFTEETNQTEFFGGFCCTDTYVKDLCNQFAEVVLNTDFKLVCPNLNKEFELNNYDTYTYTLLSFCLPLGLIANILILFLILRYRCLPKQTGYFLCSLALGDIGVILEFLCYMIYHNYSENVPPRVHSFLIPSFSVLFASVSLLQISVISVERAMAVIKPLVYQRYITFRIAKILVMLVWFTSFAMFLLSMLRIPVKSTKYADFVFYFLAGLLLIMPILIVTLCYGFVLVSALRNLGKDKEKKKERPTNAGITVTPGRRRSSFSISVLRLKQIQISVNVGIVVIPFLGCWGMFTFVHIYEVLTNYTFNGVANWFFLVLPLFVSSTNPIVYLILTKSLRKAVLNMCSKKPHYNKKALETKLSFTSGASSPQVQSPPRSRSGNAQFTTVPLIKKSVKLFEGELNER